MPPLACVANVEFLRSQGSAAADLGHCDKQLVADVVTTFTSGVDLCRRYQIGGKVHYPNYVVEHEFKHSLAASIKKLLSTGKDLGPFAWSGDVGAIPFDVVRVNPRFAVPSPYKLEPWRTRPIDDASKGSEELPSANSDQKHCPYSLHVLRKFREDLEPGWWIAATDAKGAFQQLPLRIEDMPLFLYTYYDVVNDPELKGTDQDALYAHRFGFFGPRNLPYRWMQVSWLLVAIAKMRGMRGIYAYMDDYPMAAPTELQTNALLDRWTGLMEEASIPENVGKRAVASQQSEVLGIGFDTARYIVWVPQEKIDTAKAMLSRLVHRACTTLRSLQSVHGLLQYICWALPRYAFTFLQPLRNAMQGLQLPWHRRKISRNVTQSSITLLDFLDGWNGTQEINTKIKPWTFPLLTDASRGQSGGGAYFWAGHWHNYKHTRRQRKACIAYLELYAVMVALWRHADAWRGCVVPLCCDNQTVVAVLQKGVSNSPRINALLKDVLELCLRNDITIAPYWLDTHANSLADALSRHDLQRAAPLMEMWRPYCASTLRHAIMSTSRLRRTQRKQ
jgi:hypothetical protein